jgi:8-oxo-dGTP diphosphatase
MILRDGKCLLGRRRGAHGDATYGWCGGGLEFGESLEDTARREVSEESGLIVHSLKLICVSNVRDYNHHYIYYEILDTDAEGEPRVMEPEFTESWHWYSLDDLPTPLFRATELGIESYKSGQIYNP